MSLLGINCLTTGDTVIPELGAQPVAPMVQERIKHKAEEKGTFLFFYLNVVPTGVRCGRGVRLAVLRCNGCSLCRIYSSLGGVQVGLLLKLADIFLVPDALVAEPVGYLCERRAGEGGGAEESDIKQPQQRALSSGIVSRCHV